MFRQDRCAPTDEGRGKGLAVGDLEGVVIDHLSLFDEEKIAGIGGGRLWVDNNLVGVEHVVGGKGLSVVPAHVFSQMKDDGEVVCRDIP